MPFTKEEKARQRADQFREVNNNDLEEEDPDYKACCVPSGCVVGEAVHIRDPDVVMKVVCNNKDCTEGVYMHKICFIEWEESVLTYLRSSGRARSWSEKQRRQNLWTKKGYDLAWKACSCRCGKGHLRKDLDWLPPKSLDATDRKKAKKKKSNDKPSIGRATTLQQNTTNSQPSNNNGHISNGHHHSSTNNGNGGNGIGGTAHNGRRRHTSGASVSSTDSFSSTPPTSADEYLYSPGPSPRVNNGYNIRLESTSSDRSWSPNISQSNQSIQKNGFTFSRSNSVNTTKEPVDNAPHQSPKSVDNLNDCLFLRRMDLSTFFEVLPRHKLNPYHIKMDEDGFAANEEIRKFIFNTMVLHKATSMACSMCARYLPIFDRYPLIDGTCYLTPVKHSDTNLQVNLNGKLQYLGAVCMLCLEGVHSVLCRKCKAPWDGSHHQLGTLYSYDIFAASPCCSGRVGCKQCGKPVIELSRGPFFFSQYSQTIRCPHCGVPDFHFIKPLSSYEVRANQAGNRLIC